MTLADADGKPLATLSLISTDPLEAAMDMTLTMAGRSAMVQRYFVKPDLKFYVDESRRRQFSMKFADAAAFDERSNVAAKYHLFGR